MRLHWLTDRVVPDLFGSGVGGHDLVLGGAGRRRSERFPQLGPVDGAARWPDVPPGLRDDGPGCARLPDSAVAVHWWRRVGGVMLTVTQRALLAPTASRSARHAGLDRLRGLAVLLMVLDHVLLLSGYSGELRESVTRLAMPMFFVIAGHLFRRLSRRTLVIAWAGFLLPVAVGWIDDPNVLIWYALGCCYLTLARKVGRWALWAIVALALTQFANGMGTVPVGVLTYEPIGLLALLCVGQLLPRRAFDAGARLPSGLSYVGRWPLTVYVGHVLVLAAVFGRWSS